MKANLYLRLMGPTEHGGLSYEADIPFPPPPGMSLEIGDIEHQVESVLYDVEEKRLVVNCEVLKSATHEEYADILNKLIKSGWGR